MLLRFSGRKLLSIAEPTPPPLFEYPDFTLLGGNHQAGESVQMLVLGLGHSQPRDLYSLRVVSGHAPHIALVKRGASTVTNVRKFATGGAKKCEDSHTERTSRRETAPPNCELLVWRRLRPRDAVPEPREKWVQRR